jgi:hypothetical protein
MSSFVWKIWICQNDVVFNKMEVVHYLQVINKTVYLIHMWSFLLHSDRRGLIDTIHSCLIASVLAIFSQGGWLLRAAISKWLIFVSTLSDP